MGVLYLTNLTISHAGVYDMTVTISAPSNQIQYFDALDLQFTVYERELEISIKNLASSWEFGTDEGFTAYLVDSFTDDPITDPLWKETSWACSLSLVYWDGYALSDIGTTYALNTASSSVSLTGLGVLKDDGSEITSANTRGRFQIEVEMVSTPSGITVTALSDYVSIQHQNYTAPIVEEEHKMTLRFDADFNAIIGNDNKHDSFATQCHNHFMTKYSQYNVIIGNYSVYEE